VVIELNNTEFPPEYAGKDINKPLGVREHKLSEDGPAGLADTLPSGEDIEKCVRME